MKMTIAAVRALFWIALALLSIALDREVTRFMLEHNCMPGSQCLIQAMPLIAQIGIISMVARVIIWPAALWYLGGRWLWQKINGSHGSWQSATHPRAE